MSENTQSTRYPYSSAEAPCSAAYVNHRVVELCRSLRARRVLDVGCGNGALCAQLAATGMEVVGCDASEEGIEQARGAYPQIPFHVLSIGDDVQALGGEQFDVVVSTEVIEHLYLPRLLPRFARAALKPAGHLILSTPYHGYLKNLALSLAGKWDAHFTPLWDGGHIKFWSRATLSAMLRDEGFTVQRFVGAGRLPYLWKSMILVAQRT